MMDSMVFRVGRVRPVKILLRVAVPIPVQCEKVCWFICCASISSLILSFIISRVLYYKLIGHLYRKTSFFIYFTKLIHLNWIRNISKVKNTKINQQINIYTFTIQNIKLQSKTTNINYSQSTSINNIILISKGNRQITAY